jgi:hypothetical protein
VATWTSIHPTYILNCILFITYYFTVFIYLPYFYFPGQWYC